MPGPSGLSLGQGGAGIPCLNPLSWPTAPPPWVGGAMVRECGAALWPSSLGRPHQQQPLSKCRQTPWLLWPTQYLLLSGNHKPLPYSGWHEGLQAILQLAPSFVSTHFHGLQDQSSLRSGVMSFFFYYSKIAWYKVRSGKRLLHDQICLFILSFNLYLLNP